MNCKPGDLAVIVRPRSTTKNLGKLVTVICAEPALMEEVWWQVEAHSMLHKENGAGFGKSALIQDARLRPIRDPGDDADCESKAWLPPIPTHSKELA